MNEVERRPYEAGSTGQRVDPEGPGVRIPRDGFRERATYALSSGMTEETYERYGLAANRKSTYLATFRAGAKRYPSKSPQTPRPPIRVAGMIPFTRAEFFEVFGAYNTSVWPAQVALYAVGAVLVVLAFHGKSRGIRRIPLGLCLFWVWTGVVYHWWHSPRSTAWLGCSEPSS